MNVFIYIYYEYIVDFIGLHCLEGFLLYREFWRNFLYNKKTVIDISITVQIINIIFINTEKARNVFS